MKCIKDALKFIDREFKGKQRSILLLAATGYVLLPVQISYNILAGHNHGLQKFILTMVILMLFTPFLVVVVRNSRRLKRDIREIDNKLQTMKIKLIVLETLQELEQRRE